MTENALDEHFMSVIKKRRYMSVKRREYIDELLCDLKLLKERLISVKESDSLPFSFFRESFDRMEKISRALHELELMQIGEMKEKMEQLVRFLSEQPSQPEPTTSTIEEQKEVVAEPVVERSVPEAFVQIPVDVDSEPETMASLAEEVVHKTEEDTTLRKIILPEYKDPRSKQPEPFVLQSERVFAERNGHEMQATRSMNDAIQSPPAVLDLRRGISINDRFIFQRELFHNNRAEMNEVMETLSGMSDFEVAEEFLQNELQWDFENPIVKDFLLIIKNGFA